LSKFEIIFELGGSLFVGQAKIKHLPST